ncbi:hypothetical protein L411_00309 [Escherichia coli BWH 24]|nr:hypothetical protein L411_00309 [Escherichia coli BWH 24]
MPTKLVRPGSATCTGRVIFGPRMIAAIAAGGFGASRQSKSRVRSSRRLQLSKTHRRSGSCNRMSLRTPDLLFTAIAPAIWGSTLHCHHPIPAELLTDERSRCCGVAGGFIARDDRPTDSNGICGCASSSSAHLIFRYSGACCLFRLPPAGRVAATVGAVQPLMVVFISAALLGSRYGIDAVPGAICGTRAWRCGVDTKRSARSCRPSQRPGGAVSMAFRNRADPQVATSRASASPFTAWQLAAGDFCSFQ